MRAGRPRRGDGGGARIRARAQRGEKREHQRAADRRREAAEARAQLAPLRKKVQAAEKAIAKAEEEIAQRDAKLADVDLYTSDPAKAAAIAKERARWIEARESAEEEWLAASEAYEAAEAGTALAG